MSTKRRVVVAGLDTSVRSIVNDCLPSDHFDIAEFDENANVASAAHVDLVIFCASKDLEQTQALCATLQSRIGERAPLLCCAGRYVYPLIRQPLGNAVQSMIIMPFDARELRQRLDELDLGFQVEGTAFTHRKRITKMDDRTRILQLLADRSEDAHELARKLGISRKSLFSLLMRMEKEDLIVWDGQEWAVKPPSDSKQHGTTDAPTPPEGGPDA